MTKSLSLLLVAFFFAIAPVAHAAQDALISVDQAAVRERPSMDAKIIESKSAGTTVRVSQFNKEGWYKIRATNGQYGWIWQADVTVLNKSGDVKAATLELEDKTHERRSHSAGPRFFLRAGPMLVAWMTPDISRHLNHASSELYPGFGGFGELAVRISERYRIALRIGSYSVSHELDRLDRASGVVTNYTVTHSGIPVLLGIDTDIVQGDIFQFAGGLYFGLGFNNTTTIQANLPEPNSVEISQSYFAFLLNFSAKYWLSRYIALVGELGVYYSRVPRSDLKPRFNGDTPFLQPDGNLGSVISNHAGPQTSIAIQFAI